MDDVPFSGSGPDNFDTEAEPAVVEYEQQEEVDLVFTHYDTTIHVSDLPTLSWQSMASVKALVLATLKDDTAGARIAAKALTWLVEDEWALLQKEMQR